MVLYGCPRIIFQWRGLKASSPLFPTFHQLRFLCHLSTFPANLISPPFTNHAFIWPRFVIGYRTKASVAREKFFAPFSRDMIFRPLNWGNAVWFTGYNSGRTRFYRPLQGEWRAKTPFSFGHCNQGHDNWPLDGPVVAFLIRDYEWTQSSDNCEMFCPFYAFLLDGSGVYTSAVYTHALCVVLYSFTSVVVCSDKALLVVWYYFCFSRDAWYLPASLADCAVIAHACRHSWIIGAGNFWLWTRTRHCKHASVAI